MPYEVPPCRATMPSETQLTPLSGAFAQPEGRMQECTYAQKPPADIDLTHRGYKWDAATDDQHRGRC